MQKEASENEGLDAARPKTPLLLVGHTLAVRCAADLAETLERIEKNTQGCPS